MSKFKINLDDMKHIALFESLTTARVKDCFPDGGSITFVVEENEAAKAIGKNGSNVKRLGSVIKKNIKIIEYSPDLMRFIRNLVHPLKLANIEESEADGRKVIVMTAVDSTTRGYLIGRAAENLRNYEKIAKRYFKLDELRVK